ncbi:MAG: Gfo/Idh/MocA family oxidoreductase [Acidimicrobiia bacterium]|nr:Gfo/Idh/MocA family oxidoreductase [Acidimicrobiia bacterium]
MAVARPVRVVIIGAGERGANVYGARLHTDPRATVVAVAEPDDDRRAHAVERFGLGDGAAVRSWDDLFAAPPDADAAVVATGDAHHVEPTLGALAAGWHVLLEKPMALDDADCRRIVEASEAAERTVAVCHVYRTSHLFSRLHEVITSGQLGNVVSIQLSENVAYWHHAHSYVRGLTRSSRVPMLLQKSCHDLDLLAWLAGAPARRVTSLVRPTELTEANAPPGAPERCTDGCPHQPTCPYDAVAMYVRLEPMLRDLGQHRWPPGLRAVAPALGKVRSMAQDAPLASVRRAAEWRRWPLTAVSDDPSPEAVTEALRTTRWGRCAWRVGDNDQPSAQTVDIEFTNGVLASFTLQTTSHRSMRQVRVDGTRGTAMGELAGLESWLEVTDHRSGRRRRQRFPLGTDGHGGGEAPLVDAFLAGVNGDDDGATSAREAWESHRIAFAAMAAASEGRAVDLQR